MSRSGLLIFQSVIEEENIPNALHLVEGYAVYAGADNDRNEN